MRLSEKWCGYQNKRDPFKRGYHTLVHTVRGNFQNTHSHFKIKSGSRKLKHLENRSVPKTPKNTWKGRRILLMNPWDQGKAREKLQCKMQNVQVQSLSHVNTQQNTDQMSIHDKTQIKCQYTTKHRSNDQIHNKTQIK